MQIARPLPPTESEDRDAIGDHEASGDGSRCLLSHPLFRVLGEPLFRRSDSDGEPVMVVQLGDRGAAIPLRSLLREFAIDEASDDGRMVALIVQSLDFVTGLRLGDTLPPEVLTGDASWQPGPSHLTIAATRLRLQLVSWLGRQSGQGTPVDAMALLGRGDDPAARAGIQAAFERAAQALRLAGPSDVVRLMENLAGELAYIEALRDRLLRRLQAMMAKLRPLGRGWRGDLSRLETLTQVQRLTTLALQQIGARFDELDAHTAEFLTALRNADTERVFIRANRDWLYRTLRAWDPVLQAWELAEPAMTDAAWALLGRTYQFLAPRFMPVKEWTLTLRPDRPRVSRVEGMVW